MALFYALTLVFLGIGYSTRKKHFSILEPREAKIREE
jgi:hypothetical protein